MTYAQVATVLIGMAAVAVWFVWATWPMPRHRKDDDDFEV